MTGRESARLALAQTLAFIVPVVAAIGLMLAVFVIARCASDGPLPSVEDAYALEQWEESRP